MEEGKDFGGGGVCLRWTLGVCGVILAREWILFFKGEYMVLLDDSGMQRYLTEGYVTVQTDFSAGFHRWIWPAWLGDNTQA